MLLYKKVKGYIDHEIIKVIASAALGAACSYVGLYHSVNQNGAEIRHKAAMLKKVEDRVSKIEDKLEIKLDAMSETMTEIKVMIAKMDK
jgi:hypothetical protein